MLHHMPRDRGRVSPTRALDNRQIDFSTGSIRACEPPPAPVDLGLLAPGKH